MEEEKCVLPDCPSHRKQIECAMMESSLVKDSTIPQASVLGVSTDLDDEVEEEEAKDNEASFEHSNMVDNTNKCKKEESSRNGASPLSIIDSLLFGSISSSYIIYPPFVSAQPKIRCSLLLGLVRRAIILACEILGVHFFLERGET